MSKLSPFLTPLLQNAYFLNSELNLKKKNGCRSFNDIDNLVKNRLEISC